MIKQNLRKKTIIFCVTLVMVFTFMTSISIANEKTQKQIAKKEYRKIAYLTFDDGNSTVTDKILDILKQYNVKATFFVLGINADKKRLERIIDEGHAFGSHGYSHHYSIYKNIDTLLEDMNKANDVFRQLVGVEPLLFRPPYGERKKVNQEVRREIALRDKNYVYIYWNGDSKDSIIPRATAKDVAKYSKYYIDQNPYEVVLLFHDSMGKESTAEALPEIIEYLLEKGYEIRAFNEHSYIKTITYRGLDQSFERQLSKLERIAE